MRLLAKILIALTLLTMLSCTEEVDLQLNDSYPRLVVEGNISTDTTYQYVYLSKTGSYLGEVTLPPVTGAVIKVSDGEHQYLFKPFGQNSGHYYSETMFAGVPGKTYSIVISNVDIDNDGKKETYTASEVMRNYFYVDSLQSIKKEVNGRTLYKIYGYAQEPPTVGDSYLFRYYINGSLITDSIDEARLYNDEFVNGNYLSHIPMGSVYANPGDTLVIESNSITRRHYDFVISLFLETKWSSGPFKGPPANIETNLDNGAVGYFGTEARTYFSYILK